MFFSLGSEKKTINLISINIPTFTLENGENFSLEYNPRMLKCTPFNSAAKHLTDWRKSVNKKKNRCAK